MQIENRPFDELQPGDTAELRRLCTIDDILAFANISGNHNPMHIYNRDGDGDGQPEAIVPGSMVTAFLTAVLGTVLPGGGTLSQALDVTFPNRAQAGDELVSRVTVLSKDATTGTATLQALVTRVSDGAVLLTGQAQVSAPQRKMRYDAADLPGLVVQRHRHFEALLARAKALPAMITAVACPEEEKALAGALLARDEGLITPVLVGDAARIRATAAALGADISGLTIHDIADHAEAAAFAVALVRKGAAQALMKGHLHTEDLLRPVMDRDTGLRGARRLSHVFVMDVPGLNHPLLVTDAAINIAPDLQTKVDIVQNAIDLAISLGIAVPKVGVLSAVETVNPAIPSSIDAALLSKMAERGQIKGGIVDGPLAMDNAVDLGAAKTKGLTSPVAGRAEVLVVPGIDAGNMLAKQLTYLSHAEAAGIVLGGRAPIILTSRSDDDMARLASCAVAVLHHARTGG
jgi:phosphate butyryltransferase